jgi:tRNA (guanine-N7-)-methyltransferase
VRPHRNPLSSNEDDHPLNPDEWQARIVEEQLYPLDRASTRVEFADIGCAFGGMLFALAPHFPDTMMLGLEIRSKVVDFAQGKVKALRNGEMPAPAPSSSDAAGGGDQQQQQQPAASAAADTVAGAAQGMHHYRNLWFEQCNVMKFGDCYFRRGQLTKLVFSHPDPHWKKNNARRRIITPGLVQRYAHWLAPGGLLYTVSDVPELEEWMVKCLDESPQFVRVPDEEVLKDQEWLLEIVTSTSEDAQRAVRKKLGKNWAVHRRVTYDDSVVPPLF